MLTKNKMVTSSPSSLLLLAIILPLSPASSQIADGSPSSSSFSDQGEWQMLQESIGISAMHMQLLSNNKVVMYDRTDFGRSNISLPNGLCRHDMNDTVLQVDCTAHSVLYDIASNTIRPLMVQTDTWCSSGSVRPDGSLVQTGGYHDGELVVRVMAPCTDNSCDWIEFPGYLSVRRWYSTNHILPDGRIIIVGGRRQFNYEFYPRSSTSPSRTRLSFLAETTDENENNLYPFVHLLPNGNLFIFANTRAISLDYMQNRVVQEFPSIPGGDPRNYPSSGSSVLLPLVDNINGSVEAEIMLCGGAPHDSFALASIGNFSRALATCGRIRVTDENPSWAMEVMPVARVMGDMVILPTGDVVIINGAGSGTAGWGLGRDPVTRPVIYRPQEMGSGTRFMVMGPATRPRMYHSSAVLLTDGRILVGGSNPNVLYVFRGTIYPTDLSLEAYSPPYLAPENQQIRPTITNARGTLGYNESFSVTFTVAMFLRMGIVSVRMVTPSFSTHSFGMNQRMVVMRTTGVSMVGPNTYRVDVVGPSTAEIAPPGYYMLFVVHSGIPSASTWVRIQ